MEIKVADSLEAITNLIYLAQVTAPNNLNAFDFSRYGRRQVAILAERLQSHEQD
jgi:hypothetical protein